MTAALRVISGATDEQVEVLPSVAPAPRLLVDTKTAAEVLGLGHSLFRELVRDGEVPSVQVRSRRLIRVADLEQYVKGLPC